MSESKRILLLSVSAGAGHGRAAEALRARGLAVGLPMVLISPIPGQEERNSDYLMEQGVAVKAHDAVALEYKIEHLISHGEKLARMRQNMRGLGRPEAARAVLDHVLSDGR